MWEVSVKKYRKYNQYYRYIIYYIMTFKMHYILFLRHFRLGCSFPDFYHPGHCRFSNWSGSVVLTFSVVGVSLIVCSYLESHVWRHVRPSFLFYHCGRLNFACYFFLIVCPFHFLQRIFELIVEFLYYLLVFPSKYHLP